MLSGLFELLNWNVMDVCACCSLVVLNQSQVSTEPASRMEDSTDFLQYRVLLQSSDPEFSSFVNQVETAADSQLELVLFDATERVIRSSSEYLTMGTHSVKMGDVPSGLYFISAAMQETRICFRITLLND